MVQDIGRRDLMRTGGKWIPAAGATALLATAVAPRPAEAARAAHVHPIVGTWMAKVTIPGTNLPPEEGMFAWHADGIMSGTDASRVTGFGTWRSTGRRTLTLEYQHLTVDNDKISGLVVVTMSGGVSAKLDEFALSGQAQFFDPSGKLILTHAATSTGTRFGFAPPLG